MDILTDLTNYGFKKDRWLDDTNREMYKNADELWYKKIYDIEDNHLYSVSCYLYDFTQFADNSAIDMPEELQANFDAQLWLSEDQCFNVDYSTQNVGEALAFFYKVFNNMDCISYDDRFEE